MLASYGVYGAEVTFSKRSKASRGVTEISSLNFQGQDGSRIYRKQRLKSRGLSFRKAEDVIGYKKKPLVLSYIRCLIFGVRVESRIALPEKNNRCVGNSSLTWLQVMMFTKQRALFRGKAKRYEA